MSALALALALASRMRTQHQYVAEDAISAVDPGPLLARKTELRKGRSRAPTAPVTTSFFLKRRRLGATNARRSLPAKKKSITYQITCAAVIAILKGPIARFIFRIAVSPAVGPRPIRVASP